ncbi:hypothetical protein BaRGS_00015958 [Batillaria attramentaria]|uniref:Transposable element P transposase-like RNase H domain-containing protein n=1 Tax=Batillaria attramentaria TaxID=370345 RepID=A0ABD0L117_9CAEN
MGRKGRKRLTQKKGWKARKNEQYKENAQRAREAAAMSDPPAWSWGDFLLPEGSSPEHKTITEVPGEKEDSDGATAQEFLLIIGGKAYPYDPHENVDALASSLHTSHRAQVLHQLKAEIRSLLSEQDGIYLQASKDHKVLRLIFNYDADILGLKFVLNVHFDGTLSLLVHTRPVPASHDFWAGLPKHVCTAEDVKTVVDKLLRMQVCPGNFDREFQGFVPEGVPLCDVTFESKAYKEGDMGATSSRGCRYRSTIRSVQCLLITASDGRCPHCALYRKTLWSMCRRASAREETTSQPQDFVSSHVPHVKMSRKQLYDKITQLKEQNRSLSTTLEKLRRDVFKEIREKGQVLGDMDNADLLSLLKVYKKEVEKAYPDETSLPRLFWEQQLKYSQLSSKTSMRWHPMIIRWCLYIRSRSATAYNAVRNMGFLALPSDRTLFDYSNILPSETGFVPAVARHLRKEAENLGMYSEPWRGFVGILQDEIHVCEGLVYDRNNGHLVGYVSLDETANELLAMANGQKKKRPKLASSMLVLMVRGATSGLRFPFAVFATTGITAEFLYPILWKAIQILEPTAGFLS